MKLNSGELDPVLKYRVDLEKRNSAVEKADNFLFRKEGTAVRRPGTEYIPQFAGISPTTLTRNITWQYISENGKIWGLPYDSPIHILTLDAGHSPRQVATGIALPCYLHPFKTGQTITISGSAGYNGNYTVLAATTTNEIVITHSFVAGVFTGNESVIMYKNVAAGAGRMVIDVNGNLYYGNSGSSQYITKVSPDFLTVDVNFFAPVDSNMNARSVLGLAITKDNRYLYVWFGDAVALFKFDLSDGSLVWKRVANQNFIWIGGTPFAWTAAASYDIAIDNEDSAYIITASSVLYTSGQGLNISKFLSDGTFVDWGTNLWSWGGPYEIHVDNDMYFNGQKGVVIGGGGNWYDSSYPSILDGNNLHIRTLDNSDGKRTRIGGDPCFITGTTYSTDHIGSSCLTTHNGFIYVADIQNDTLYKLNPNLEIVGSVVIPYLRGVMVNAYGIITAARVDYVTTVVDSLWYYDDDLNYIGKADGITIIGGWGPYVWLSGNLCYKTPIDTNSRTYTYTTNLDDPFSYNSTTFAANSALRLIPFEYSSEDAYVLGFGDNSISFYRTGDAASFNTSTSSIDTIPFFDGFESGGVLNKGWTKSDANVTAIYTAKYTGDYGAKLSGTAWIQKVLNTSGYGNIHVKYRRQATGFDSGENLYVDWSADGNTWNNLETVNFPQYTDVWPNKYCFGADNTATFYLRFRTNANQTAEYAYIDDINVTGKLLPLYPPSAASDPNPPNNSVAIAVTQDINWIAGAGATSHDVYWGTTSPGTYKGNQVGASYDTGTMTKNTKYYWRIDEVNDDGTTTGIVWNFTTIPNVPTKANNPHPSNAATNVLTNDYLWWSSSYATDYNVYFGTVNPPPFVETITVKYYYPALSADTLYYWRVDVNNLAGKVVGDVWSFDTNIMPEPASTLLIVNDPCVTGNISPAGDVDWYRFVVASDGTYHIETYAGTLTDNDTYMYLYENGSWTIVLEEDDDGGAGYLSLIERSLTAGTYYVKIRAYDTSYTGTYGIRVTTVP